MDLFLELKLLRKINFSSYFINRVIYIYCVLNQVELIRIVSERFALRVYNY